MLPKPPALTWVSNERTRSAWSYVDVPVWVRSQPAAARRDRLRPYYFLRRARARASAARTLTAWT